VLTDFDKNQRAWYASAYWVIVGSIGGETMGVSLFASAHVSLMALVLLVGCSKDPLGRNAISGTVKLDGTPLDKGNISFQPLEGGQTSSGAVISGGNFSILRDKGLPTGKYRVEINAAAPGGAGKAAAADALPGDSPPPPKELIPAEWNEASTHTIEVKKGGPLIFPFEIATKGK